MFTRRELIEKIDPFGIPYAPVNTVSEVVEDPHVQARGSLIEMESEKGPLRVPGMAIRLSETPGTIRRPAPRLGEHAKEILRGIGYSDEEIVGLRERKVIA